MACLDCITEKLHNKDDLQGLTLFYNYNSLDQSIKEFAVFINRQMDTI